jgi:hypothetical protein
MGFEEQEWVEHVDLRGSFDVHWTIPWGNLLEEILHTW